MSKALAGSPSLTVHGSGQEPAQTLMSGPQGHGYLTVGAPCTGINTALAGIP